jgi:hypothetical protein
LAVTIASATDGPHGTHGAARADDTPALPNDGPGWAAQHQIALVVFASVFAPCIAYALLSRLFGRLACWRRGCRKIDPLFDGLREVLWRACGSRLDKVVSIHDSADGFSPTKRPLSAAHAHERTNARLLAGALDGPGQREWESRAGGGGGSSAGTPIRVHRPGRLARGTTTSSSSGNSSFGPNRDKSLLY